MTELAPAIIFRIEARELLEQLEHDLLALVGASDNREAVGSVFRGLHTLKGSGAMFGFEALVVFAHQVETIFDRVRKGEITITAPLVSAALAARDHMCALVEGEAPSRYDADQLLGALHSVCEWGGQSGGAMTWHIRFSLPAPVEENDPRLVSLWEDLRALGSIQLETPQAAPEFSPSGPVTPAELRTEWSLHLVSDQPRAAIEDAFLFVSDDLRLEIIADPGTGEASAPLIEATGSALLPSQATAPAPTAQSMSANEFVAAKAGGTLRVAAERLDGIMDGFGELVIAQSRLKQLAASSSDVALRAVAEEIERLAGEMRDTMMVVRMVPIAQLFGRFRRLVHDLERDTGKQIELATEGETTELDKTVIERLADPLIHLIRNSADHGLEGAEQRAAAGKPTVGKIMLTARQSGADVVITISDDGRGVDRERVRAKAEESGLIQPGQVLSDNELLQLIFAPGFSTATAITNLSGRGVGMDVVKKTIEGLRGSIEISSTPGEGSVVSLRIPLTLAIIDGLLIRVGSSRYVIPLATVEECVELTPAQDLRSTGRNLITLRDELVPFIRLREQFATGTQPDQHQKIVVVATGQDRVGLVVDQILGDHQTVIKPMSAFHQDVGAFSGATIMGDGGVALILDIAALVSLGQRHDAQMRAAG